MSTIINGTDGGSHVVDGPLTTELSAQASPSLLLNEIDQQIVKIRPMATPIDQISRYAGSKHSGSMVVNYYSVDTKPTSALVSDDHDPADDDIDSGAGTCIATLATDNDNIFDASDTILAQGVDGAQGTGELVLYVLSRDSASGLRVMAINGVTISGIEGRVPEIPAGTTLIRMGRAATELDVMSPQFEALPKRMEQFCQIFKMQVEQSTLQRLSNKEIGWTLSDQEEAAIYDMRQGMEKSFLFGVKGRLWNPDKRETVMLTGGIWQQAGKTFRYTGSLSGDSLVDMMREAFTGNAGSKRKVLIGGSDLISQISKLDVTRVVSSREGVSHWGIDFTELHSKFGTLYVLLSEVFDEVGMADSGIIIDPEYMQKYSHIPFSAEALNLKASGVRNTDALVLSEASCIVLRYPNAHVRIVKR